MAGYPRQRGGTTVAGARPEAPLPSELRTATAGQYLSARVVMITCSEQVGYYRAREADYLGQARRVDGFDELVQALEGFGPSGDARWSLRAVRARGRQPC